MCIGIPGRIEKIKGEGAVIDSQGIKCTISLALVPEAEIGDWVLVHAGFAITLIDQEQAVETLALIDEMKRHAEAH